MPIDDLELSVVMPCLNEENTIRQCIDDCLNVFKEHSIHGEVIIVDNGSTDSSIDLISKTNATLITEPNKGYGAALRSGFNQASGKYTIMMDSDGTYDPYQIPLILNLLKSGKDFVNGTRLTPLMEKGSMPFLHRWVGVPLLGWLVRVVSGSKLKDAHCGIRGFKSSAVRSLGLKSDGMELASEIIIMAARNNLPTAEFVAEYRLRKGSSKLNTIHDGWRHLRLILSYGPSQFVFVPGITSLIVGWVLLIALFTGPIFINGFMFDYHYMLLGSVLSFIGLEITILGLIAKSHTVAKKITPNDFVVNWGLKHLSVEKALLAGFVILCLGGLLSLYILSTWFLNEFSFPSQNMIRQGIFATSMLISGTQLIFGILILGLYNSHTR